MTISQDMPEPLSPFSQIGQLPSTITIAYTRGKG